MKSEKVREPIVDVTGKRIVKVGIVVRNAVKTAMRYSEIFGIGPWLFTDKGDTASTPSVVTRCAVADFGSLRIELFQPVCGPSTYRDFLESRGEGIHHAGLGEIDDYDAVMAALKENGVAIDAPEKTGGDSDLFYTNTRDTLGIMLEIKKRRVAGEPPRCKPWGKYEPKGPGAVDLQGKELNQIGIVVADVEKTAKAFWELFGIGPWVFIDGRSDGGGVLHDVPYADGGAYIKIATAELGSIQFELLQPVAGVTSHMEFLNTHGQGPHHVSFGDITADHDATVDAMGQQGVGIEMSGTFGGSISFTYFETQKDLGTIYEILKVDPSIECTLVPTGIYPPQ